MPDKVEDKHVGMCSMADKYMWLIGHLYTLAEAAAREQAADATIEIDDDTMQQMIDSQSQRFFDEFFTEQENLLCQFVPR